MGRSKSVSDDLLLDRLRVAMRAYGPANLSFARAAEAGGLAAATLVQRFGSREGLVEAVLLSAWDQLDAATTAAEARSAPDAPGAIDLLLHLTSSDRVEYDFSDGLLLLREDLVNPVLRARGAQWGSRLAEALGHRLSHDAGRAPELGWQMASLWQGTLLWWAFRRDGDPKATVRAALEAWGRSVGVL